MKPRILTLSIVSLLLTPFAARAVTDTWDGGGANNNISTNNNWADNSAPVSNINTTDLVFAGSTRPTPVVDAPFNARSVTFEDISFGFEITGFNLRIGTGGITNNDPDIDYAYITAAVDFSLVATSSINAATAPLFLESIFLPMNTLSIFGSTATFFTDVFGTGNVFISTPSRVVWRPTGLAECDFVLNNSDMDVELEAFLGSNGSLAVNGTSTLDLEQGMVITGGSVTRMSGGSLTIGAGRELTVQAGGDVTITGTFTNTTASTITVTGAGSTFTTTAALGFNAGSVLNVFNGGDVSGATINIGTTTGGGTVTVSGGGSSLTGTATIGAPSGSTGILNVNSSGTFNSGTGTTTVNATGTISINGGTFNSIGNLTLNGGRLERLAGTFELSAGRTLTIQAGGDADFTGALTNMGETHVVTGAGSTLTTTSSLSIFSNGSLAVSSGADVNTNGSLLWVAHGSATVAGAGSTLVGGSLTIGVNGGAGSVAFSNSSVGIFSAIHVGDSDFQSATGSLQIQSGATVSGSSLSIASETFEINTGTVTINGAGSSLTLAGAAKATLGTSFGSSGVLNVQSSGTFNSGTGLTTVEASSTVAITGGGTFNANGNLTLKGGQLTRDLASTFALDAGKTFTVQGGGDASFGLAYANTTASAIVVTGAGSTLSSSGTLGFQGGSTLDIAAGGSVTSGLALSIGTTGGAAVSISGAGSALTAATTTTIGAASGSSATVNIGSGGIFTTGTGLTTVDATGDVNVNAGGTLIVRGDMTIANGLDIANGGVVILGAVAPAPAPEFALGEFDFGGSESGVETAAVPEPGVAALLLSALGFLGTRRGRIRGARASRVLVSASRRNELSERRDSGNVRAFRTVQEVREGGTRMLPGALCATPFVKLRASRPHSRRA